MSQDLSNVIFKLFEILFILCFFLLISYFKKKHLTKEMLITLIIFAAIGSFSYYIYTNTRDTNANAPIHFNSFQNNYQLNTELIQNTLQVNQHTAKRISDHLIALGIYDISALVKQNGTDNVYEVFSPNLLPEKQPALLYLYNNELTKVVFKNTILFQNNEYLSTVYDQLFTPVEIKTLHSKTLELLKNELQDIEIIRIIPTYTTKLNGNYITIGRLTATSSTKYQINIPYKITFDKNWVCIELVTE
ncbi:MAG TPA: hypothetical protein IAB06_04760 [Candidatus Avacidaminococcus intestinavium]|uniref:Uncharacterized protein n=1 Tax=Candidatus Avacidaminococcus intestinavium TaxID=2840684 RepID=A0A9D1MPN6_9FIRM|nr:hypothetical protein [Candidatus Avacidaminococcus intestinavium]